ncbi:MAG: 4-hydroxy-tetrahydrodipicolinate reductase [Spirochaetaceae bacterium]
MRFLLSGYGRMGHEIEAVALERNHIILGKIDPAAPGADYPSLEAYAAAGGPQDAAGAEAVIDFALREGIVDRVRFYAERGLPAVVGTTGWDELRDEVRRVVEDAGASLIWASNFSIGAQLLFRMASYASRLAAPFDGYDVYIHETHHGQKADSPSGTALSLAERVLEGVSRKKRILTETAHRRIEPEELHVSSTRGGANPGEHHVVFDSPADSIELVHRARNRSGFASGAVVAAEWIAGKSGFYSIDDLFDDLTKGGV